MKILARGAEAILYECTFQGLRAIVKERIKKGYRISQLDLRLRQSRTEAEARLLAAAARAGVKTPSIYKSSKFKLVLQYIDGLKLRDWIERRPAQLKQILRQVGLMVAKMHDAGIIHGDLTTSNMILHNGQVYFIDFGLGFFSKRLEDKAVDLHLFKECLTSKHASLAKICWNAFLDGYKHSKNAQAVLERLKIVETRARYK